MEGGLLPRPAVRHDTDWTCGSPDDAEREVVHRVIYDELVQGIISADVPPQLHRNNRRDGGGRLWRDHRRMHRDRATGASRRRERAIFPNYEAARRRCGRLGAWQLTVDGRAPAHVHSHRWRRAIHLYGCTARSIARHRRAGKHPHGRAAGGVDVDIDGLQLSGSDRGTS